MRNYSFARSTTDSIHSTCSVLHAAPLKIETLPPYPPQSPDPAPYPQISDTGPVPILWESGPAMFSLSQAESGIKGLEYEHAARLTFPFLFLFFFLILAHSVLTGGHWVVSGHVNHG